MTTIYSPYSNIASAATDSDEFDFPSMLFVLRSDSITLTDDAEIETLPNLVTAHASSPDEAVNRPDSAVPNKMRWRSGASGSAINGLPVIQGGAGRGIEFDLDASKPVVPNSSWSFYWAGRMPSFPQTTEGHLWGDYRDVVSDPIDGFIVESLIMHAPSGGDNLGYAYDVQNNNNRITQTTIDNLTGVQVLAWIFDKSIPDCKLYRNGELIFTGTWVTGGGTWNIIDDFKELFTSNTVANDDSFFGDTIDFWGALAAHNNTDRQAIEALLLARAGLTAPTAPSNLVATTFDDDRIDITWDDNSADETSFQLQRSPDGLTGWVTIATLAANDEDYSNTGLDPSTQYCYRVRAFKGTMPSAWSNTDCDTTDASAFNPYSLGNQVWMFESDSITPQGDNTDLALWPDDSGNANDIAFPSSEGGSQPKYRTNHFNGTLPAVQVQSTDQGETGAVTGGATASSLTQYFVLDYQVADQSSGFALAYYDNSFSFEEQLAFHLCSDAVGANQVTFESLSSSFVDLAAATNGKQVLTFVADKVTDTVKLYRNGTLVATQASASTNGYDLMAPRQWFAINGAGTGQFIGYVGAHFCYKETHDNTTRGNVETYLMTKYGVP